MRFRHVSFALPGASVMPRRTWQSAGLFVLTWILFVPSLLVAECPPPDPDFHEPACIYRDSTDPNTPSVLSTTLEMATGEAQVGDRQLRMAMYNTSLPGPTLRLRRGDALKILLKNAMVPLGVPDDGPAPPGFLQNHALPQGLAPVSKQLSQIYTNLHTHGLQVSPKDPGDNVLLVIPPGECHQYEYTIPTGDPPTNAQGLPTPAHPTGLHWYHPHFHGSTTHQGWQGLSGALIIEGEIDQVPEVKAAKERLLVLNELWVGEDGTVPTALVVPNAGWSPFTSIPAVPTDMLFTINGVYQPQINIQQGETQRWRVLAAGPHRFFWLKVDGHELYQIAQDGIPFAKPRKVDSILLATGNRAEFIIKGGPQGKYAIRALAYEQGHPGGKRPERLLGTLVSAGVAKPEGKIPTTLVTPFKIPDKLLKGPIKQRRLVFRGDVSSVPVKFTINDKEFEISPESWWEVEPTDPRPIPGTVEEWTLVNEDIFQHPFHIHVNPFQVLEITGAPKNDPTWVYDKDIWWDVFRMPSQGSVKIRIYFRPDAPGLTVFHCHILPHEDNGMMGTVCINPDGDAGTCEYQLKPNCPS